MKHFPMLLLSFWWGSWLLISYTPLNSFKKPSVEVSILYMTSFLFVSFGYYFFMSHLAVERRTVEKSLLNKPYIRKSLFKYSYISLIFVISILYYVGAFTTSFSDYFIKVRGLDALLLVSGSGLIDYGLKIIVYPMMLSVLLIVVSNPDGKRFGLLLLLSFIFFCCFSYFFQVNYPMILLVIIVFISLFNPCISSSVLNGFRKKSLLPLFMLITLIIIAAFNRFGSNDVAGVLSHYLISYHTLGFSFFDNYYQLQGSLLHEHSFGLSLFGTFDFIFSYFYNLCGGEYIAATTQNVIHNSQPVELGKFGGHYSNAFGTYLFSFYRDFNFVGVLLYSFIYGAILASTYKKSVKGDRISYSLFLYFISMGIIAIYVSPLDYSYFWIVPCIVLFVRYQFKLNGKGC